VRLLAAAEHDRHLDLVVLAQEPLHVALLGFVVVVGDLRAQLDLAHVDLLLVLARGLCLLLLLVLVLRVVEQPCHRRVGLRRDLDQVEVRLAGAGERVVARHDPDLLPVGADQAHLARPDVLVDASRVALWRPAVEPAGNRH
jgi:hypothetical protein